MTNRDNTLKFLLIDYYGEILDLLVYDSRKWILLFYSFLDDFSSSSWINAPPLSFYNTWSNLTTFFITFKMLCFYTLVFPECILRPPKGRSDSLCLLTMHSTRQTLTCSLSISFQILLVSPLNFSPISLCWHWEVSSTNPRRYSA